MNSGEIWFINFYSPRCSHCHQLAPTVTLISDTHTRTRTYPKSHVRVCVCVCQWREFAREMDGIIRIGAVNCGDNNHLCRRKGIGSYPSLYIFSAGQVGAALAFSVGRPFALTGGGGHLLASSIRNRRSSTASASKTIW